MTAVDSDVTAAICHGLPGRDCRNPAPSGNHAIYFFVADELVGPACTACRDEAGRRWKVIGEREAERSGMRQLHTVYDTNKPNEPKSVLGTLRSHVLDGDSIENLPAPEPLVADLLDLDSLAVLFGRPAGGKTHVAVDLSLSIATGSWWHGQEVKQGHVLYVVAEGARGVGQRQRAWKDLNRYYGSLDGRISWIPVPVNLLGPDNAAALAAIAAERQAVLVVIDTLGRSMAGGDENAYKDMSLVIDAAERIRAATGACVLLVHHSGKDQSAGSRGHSSLLGAVHTELEVKNGGDGIITLSVTKQKDHADTVQPWRFILKPAADSVAIARYDGRRNLIEDIRGKARTTLEALESIDIPGGVTASQWEETAVQNGVSRSGFFQHRKALLDFCQVQNVGTDQRPRYSLVTREDA